MASISRAAVGDLVLPCLCPTMAFITRLSSLSGAAGGLSDLDIFFWSMDALSKKCPKRFFSDTSKKFKSDIILSISDIF
jgi:hypothetical protein